MSSNLQRKIRDTLVGEHFFSPVPTEPTLLADSEDSASSTTSRSSPDAVVTLTDVAFQIARYTCLLTRMKLEKIGRNPR